MSQKATFRLLLLFLIPLFVTSCKTSENKEEGDLAETTEEKSVPVDLKWSER